MVLNTDRHLAVSLSVTSLPAWQVTGDSEMCHECFVSHLYQFTLHWLPHSITKILKGRQRVYKVILGVFV
jgi:hypothetical protein